MAAYAIAFGCLSEKRLEFSVRWIHDQVHAWWPDGFAGVDLEGLRALLDEMVDLRGMAEFPDPAYTCRQFSSYDRASKSSAEEWFANADAGHYLRVETVAGRNEHVLMDVPGPGAVVRIWSANPAGTLRIYIDGADKPALTAPMTTLRSRLKRLIDDGPCPKLILATEESGTTTPVGVVTGSWLTTLMSSRAASVSCTRIGI